MVMRTHGILLLPAVLILISFSNILKEAAVLILISFSLISFISFLILILPLALLNLSTRSPQRCRSGWGGPRACHTGQDSVQLPYLLPLQIW